MNRLLTILGPTASGKTELACHVALELNAEIISADSRQLYRYMDIGTGKDIEEYSINGQDVPYHLIDIHEPTYKYNIADYQIDFHNALAEIKTRGKEAILCGGSGLYIETALKGTTYLGIETSKDLLDQLSNCTDNEINEKYDALPQLIKDNLNALTRARKVRAIGIHDYILNNPNWKPREFEPIESIIIGVDIDRNLRREKITKRLSHRLNNGMIEEAELLIDKHLTHEQMSFFGLEYKWLSLYLRKKISKKELFEGLNTAIHQFSKRQMTWFRRMEKKGYQIHWVDASESLESKKEKVLTLYAQK